jgi:hypothetical protein
MPTFTDDKGNASPAITSCEKLAVASRDSYVDLWAMCSSGVVDQATRRAGDDAGELAKLSRLTGTLSGSKLASALEEWQTTRAASQPDLKALSTAADAVTDEAEKILKILDSAEMAKTRVEASTAAIVELLKGMVRAVAGEADTVLAGGRVPAANAGEAMCVRLERWTPDANWRQKLEDTPTWLAANRQISPALDRTLRPGEPMDHQARETRMKALDAALLAWKDPKVGDPDPYQRGTDLIKAYNGVIDAVHSDILMLRQSLLPKGAAGKHWTREGIQQAMDVLYGTMRVVRDELAADPIAVDADLSPAVRRTLSLCDNFTGPTTQDKRVASAQKDFGEFWRTTRDQGLTALTALAAEDATLADKVKPLQQQFKSLAPLLDQWSTQIAQGADATGMHDLTINVEATLTKYRNAVTESVGFTNGAGILTGLDAISAGLALKIRTSPFRARLFS